jgi:hypothetical protein
MDFTGNILVDFRECGHHTTNPRAQSMTRLLKDVVTIALSLRGKATESTKPMKRSRTIAGDRQFKPALANANLIVLYEEEP